jgi:hypothetical protein
VPVLVSDVISRARFRTDQDAGFAQVDDADLVKAVSDIYGRLHALVAKADPGTLEQTDTFSLSSGDTVSLATEAADFWLLLGVEKLLGGTYQPLDRFVWEERGGLTSNGITGDYRFRYIPKATALTATNSPLLDAVTQNGWDEYVTEHLAALIRVRLDDDPRPHLERAKVVEAELRALADARDLSEPATVADVWADDCFYPVGPVYCLRGTTLHLRNAGYR